MRDTPAGKALASLHLWLDSWRGIGAVTVGMARQGYDLQLTPYDEQGWRATFYPSGMVHSATSAIGSTWESTPWRRVGCGMEGAHEGGDGHAMTHVGQLARALA